MPRSVRYEQLDQGHPSPSSADSSCCSGPCCASVFRGLLLILLYFVLSIGLTFYQQHLLHGFRFPLSVVVFHLVVKFCLAAFIRGVLFLWTGNQRVSLPLFVSLKSVAPTGLASGIDVGFSNWALELVSVSLYTMTKSTAIIFILFFAILLGLEKKSWSLVVIIVMISSGLTMFTYKSTEFNILGFCLLLIASLSSGLRWTFAQVLMQKSKLGLNNPLDMVYYVQPWMLLSVLPLAVGFEGLQLIQTIAMMPNNEVVPYIFMALFGACIAFAMELSEFLVVTYTSSLTLSISGIFKEICMLVLAILSEKRQLSLINGLGLVMCLIGIIIHVVHKFATSSLNNHIKVTSINYPSRISDNEYVVTETLDVSVSDMRDVTLFRRNAKTKFDSMPMRGGDNATSSLLGKDNDPDYQSCDSEDDSNVILEIINRRDIVR